MAFTYPDMGHAFHKHILRIFRNGWMDSRDAFHACLRIFSLCNGQNIAEYEAYWIMGAPIYRIMGIAHERKCSQILQKYWSIHEYFLAEFSFLNTAQR